MMEHQLDAYTNCNYVEGLAVLHPVCYCYNCENGAAKFVWFVIKVWNIPAEGKSEIQLAYAGVDVLADFIRKWGFLLH